MMNERAVLESLGYRVTKEIASGTDGRVVLATNLYNNQVVAVKLVEMHSSLSKLRFKREAMNSLSLGNNKYIVKSRSFHQRDDVGVIVMDYIQATDLMSYFLSKQILKEDECREIFQKMCEAIAYCHMKNIAHLDIKPDNFLIDPLTKTIHLCDFFRSINWEQHHCNDSELNNSTTLFYRPPETFYDSDKVHDLSKMDVWSMGVCLFGLLFGFFPFDKTYSALRLREEVDFDFDKLDYFLESNLTISENAKDLISCMLDPNPFARISMEEVLSHPFFKI